MVAVTGTKSAHHRPELAHCNLCFLRHPYSTANNAPKGINIGFSSKVCFCLSKSHILKLMTAMVLVGHILQLDMWFSLGQAFFFSTSYQILILSQRMRNSGTAYFPALAASPCLRNMCANQGAEGLRVLTCCLVLGTWGWAGHGTRSLLLLFQSYLHGHQVYLPKGQSGLGRPGGSQVVSRAKVNGWGNCSFSSSSSKVLTPKDSPLAAIRRSKPLCPIQQTGPSHKSASALVAMCSTSESSSPVSPAPA